MLIQNITFFASENMVPVLLQKIRSEIIPTLMKGADSTPRLAEVELPETAQTVDAPRSLSLQFEFGSRGELEKWQKDFLQPMMNDLVKEMGEEGLVFPSVLRVLDI